MAKKNKNTDKSKEIVAQLLMDKYDIEPYKMLDGKAEMTFNVDTKIRRDIHTGSPKCLLLNVVFLYENVEYRLEHLWVQENKNFTNNKHQRMKATGKLFIYRGTEGESKAGLKGLKSITNK